MTKVFLDGMKVILVGYLKPLLQANAPLKFSLKEWIRSKYEILIINQYTEGIVKNLFK
jgi:hypothetical protein